MKKFTCLFLILVSQIIATSTDPIGLTTLNINTGANFISYSYNEDPIYNGLVNEVVGNKIVLDDLYDNFDTYEYLQENELTDNPHFLKIKDGDNAGHVFPILTNKENAVYADLSVLSPAVHDQVSIIPCSTLSEIFSIFTEDFGENDRLLLWMGGWRTFFFKNNTWHTFGTKSPQGKTIVYPDEGMVYIRDGDPFTIQTSGNISLNSQLFFPETGKKFLMSNPFPMDLKLSELIPLDGWEKSEHQNKADQIGIWTGTSWMIYYCNLANEWQPSDLTISSGQSFFILRTDSVAVTGGFKKLNIPHYEPRKDSYYTYEP